MENGLSRIVYDYLLKTGMTENLASYINLLILLAGILLLAWFLDWIIWKILKRLSVSLAKKSRSNFDDFLVANRVPRYLAHIIPLIALIKFVPLAFSNFAYGGQIALKILQVLFVILTLYTVRSILLSIKEYLKIKPRFHDKPMNSYIQVFMIFAWIVGIFTIFAIITEVEIWKFFTALGAGSAVILLIFKDSILGLVASIQVSINDMLRIGDWITFEKFGADGAVNEINLATVKIQNFDNTITTIPTYALISDSFKNWRGMQESGGRRIKRALNISQRSIRFLSETDIEKLKKIQLISNYLDTRTNDIAAFNTAHKADRTVPINGRNLTNFGVFRKYVTTYLENNPAVNKDMTLMVRQQAPTSEGIPLEIYAFSSDKRWENYEYVMADIFDHILSALPYFELEIFELPTSLGNISKS